MDTEKAGPVRRGHAPEVVAPSNRINVALPFSTMHIQEPSRELVEIASALAALALVVERVAPGDDASQVRIRVEALVARLR